MTRRMTWLVAVWLMIALGASSWADKPSWAGNKQGKPDAEEIEGHKEEMRGKRGPGKSDDGKRKRKDKAKDGDRYRDRKAKDRDDDDGPV